ncbi:hypothetical protein HAX54_008683 [Datura stramonium]|uniref:Uncharacterized protein n=1 Tax=Datura stramonium TaxID=4076 RepID=A0ABS8TF94_DATST|nr:hypothetical protein [Datura stramonium]
MKTKYGGKIKVDILDDIDRDVGDEARDIANYCGLIVRSTVSFLDGDWPAISAKHGQTMWLKVKGRIQTLVTQQQFEENENPMTGDEILASVLGEHMGYIYEKGYGKKPPRKNRFQQADVEASVSSAITNVRQQMQVEMDRKLHEE